MGDHLIQCDISGQVCLRSEARMTWRGTLVSNQNWDPKHPQLTINVPPDEVSIANARPFNGSGITDDATTTGIVAITDQTVAFAAELLPSSGVTPGVVSGLYSDPTITSNANGQAGTYDLGTTLIDNQTARRVGTESCTVSILPPPPVGSGNKSSAYANVVINPGEKKYVEFEIVSVGSLEIIGFGFAIEGFELPAVELGVYGGEFALYADGRFNVAGLLNSISNMPFGVGDRVSMAVDYTVQGDTLANLFVYLNGVFVKIYVLGFSNHDGDSLRVAAQVAVCTQESEDGNEIKILTHQGTQDYAPPNGFQALET